MLTDLKLGLQSSFRAEECRFTCLSHRLIGKTLCFPALSCVVVDRRGSIFCSEGLSGSPLFEMPESHDLDTAWLEFLYQTHELALTALA